MTGPLDGDSPWRQWARAEIARTDWAMRQSGALILVLGLVSGAAAGSAIGAAHRLPLWAGAVLAVLCGAVGGASAVRLLRSQQEHGLRLRCLTQMDQALRAGSVRDPRTREELRDAALRMHHSRPRPRPRPRPRGR